jgi:hypothetical protein
MSLEYADNLFKKQEYYRAISEYDRYAFFSSITQKDSNYCFLQITKCYYLGEEYENMISYVNSLIISESQQYFFDKYKGLAYLKLNYPRMSKSLFEKYSNPESVLLKGISELYLREWDLGNITFNSLLNCADDQISDAAKDLSLVAKFSKELYIKNPYLAGFLSIFPGGGYIYTEKYQTAFSSLVLNSLILGSSYELYKKDLNFTASFSLFVSLGFYIGNIYGSILSAAQFNESYRKEYLDNAVAKYIHLVYLKQTHGGNSEN